MLYIYRQEASDGARLLAEVLEGARIRRSPTPRPEDAVVCWGESAPSLSRALNHRAPIRSKLTDAQMLQQARIPTIEVSATQPRAETPVDPALEAWLTLQQLAEDVSGLTLGGMVPRSGPFLTGLDTLQQAVGVLRTRLALPPPQPRALGEWLPRMNNHVGGQDLLTPPTIPDYWAKKELLTREFRVHSFLGRSIRAGMKVQREDHASPHPWIRSFDAGWRIAYDGSARQVHRDLAHAACAALALDFGAVDIGETPSGSLLVLEVNRAPGLEGGTVDAYARAVQRWMDGDPT